MNYIYDNEERAKMDDYSIMILFIYLKQHEKKKKKFILTNKRQESDEEKKYMSIVCLG
jgi:hypothetical protein